jgi:hypothetical protein
LPSEEELAAKVQWERRQNEFGARLERGDVVEDR